jgi:hypothetical protein
MIDNIVAAKSYAFAIRIVRLYEVLSAERKEFVLSANVTEGNRSWSFDKGSRASTID